MPQSSPQRSLASARILVAGVGGLGHPAALALAAAGVGTIGLVDGDAVELSNLPRQVLFAADDVGTPKVDAAARRLSRLYPHVRLETHLRRLDGTSAATILPSYDFIIDATDRTESKFLVHDAALRAGKPLSHAGVVGDRGQMMTVLPGRSCCLRCLFPEAPADDEVPTCEQAGVIGPFVGLFGTLQAAEAVKFTTAMGTLLADRLLTVDRGRWRSVELARDPVCAACGNLG